MSATRTEDYIKSQIQGLTVIDPGTVTLHPRLGSGGSGYIHPATTSDGRNIIAKVYTSDKIYERPWINNDNRDFIDSVVEETNLYAKISNNPQLKPYIVEALGYSAFPFIIYMPPMMSDLSTYLKNNPDLNLMTKLNLIKQITDGLFNFHLWNYVHQDFKSDNILLDEHLQPKLCDFGETKVTNSKNRDGNSTPSYKAPEVKISEAAQKSTDIYSLGIIMWEIMTQKDPFEELRGYQVLSVTKLGCRPIFPDTIPNDIATLIRQCWDQDPARRPTARVVLDAIRNIIANVEANPQNYSSFSSWSSSSSSSRSSVIPLASPNTSDLMTYDPDNKLEFNIRYCLYTLSTRTPTNAEELQAKYDDILEYFKIPEEDPNASIQSLETERIFDTLLKYPADNRVSPTERQELIQKVWEQYELLSDDISKPELLAICNSKINVLVSAFLSLTFYNPDYLLKSLEEEKKFKASRTPLGFFNRVLVGSNTKILADEVLEKFVSWGVLKRRGFFR